MTTVLQYLVIAAVIAAVLFGIALLVFGRGEQLPALPARTSPASLPKQDITGEDVRSVRFGLALRGYRMSDVDWTLERLAEELDRTRARLADLEAGDAEVGGSFEDPEQDDLFGADELGGGPSEQPSPVAGEPDLDADPGDRPQTSGSDDDPHTDRDLDEVQSEVNPSVHR